MTTNRILIWAINGWCLITLINYYYTNFFILPFYWIGMNLMLLILLVIQVSKLIKERKYITKLRIVKLIVFSTLFFLTLFKDIPNQFIEMLDWQMFKDRRIKIVEQVKNGKLQSNQKYGGICELSFEFPVVSNGGNDIWITHNKLESQLTVRFWIFRNFFEAPSTYFIYTNDLNKMNIFEKKIITNPKENWKIESNWYRIKGN